MNDHTRERQSSANQASFLKTAEFDFNIPDCTIFTGSHKNIDFAVHGII